MRWAAAAPGRMWIPAARLPRACQCRASVAAVREGDANCDPAAGKTIAAQTTIFSIQMA